MRSPKYILLLFSFLTLFPLLGQAKYLIKGKVNLYDDWQPQVYLASIEKINDYYRASADLVIKIASVQVDGSFLIEGDNLPNEYRFYRLYLMKQQNREYDACLFVGGDDHNFVHVVLNNESQLEIVADSTAYSPFGKYKILGDPTNQRMQSLSNIVYPSFEFYKFRFPTELKLSEEKLQQELKLFSDTCTSPIVSLAAVINSDFDEYFEKDHDFYMTFGDRLQMEMPNSVYTKNYFRKLNYYAFENPNQVPIWAKGLIGFLLVCLIGLGSFCWRLNQKLKHQAELLDKTKEQEAIENLYDRLTLKEREILALIQQRKSNKEIASALFVEVSTVKTHINKIYSKLEVRNRREVLSLKIGVPS